MDYNEQKTDSGQEEGQIIVLLIPDEEYSKRVMSITKDLSKGVAMICYVSLNLPYTSLLKNFKDLKIDASKFYVIDCITQTAEISKKTENC